jgi:APA family basic amino acid/polyamine antiporter
MTGTQRGRLLRVLGVGFGLAVIVGNTIGAGILRTPGDIARELPQRWWVLAVWVGGALYALLGTNSLAELGAALPRSGGHYVFSHRALGPYPGFIVGWSDWVATCGTAAAVSIAIGEVTARLFAPVRGREVVVALAVIAVLTLVQWRGVRWGGRLQEVSSLAKAVAFLVLVAACWLLPARGAALLPSEVAAVTLAHPAGSFVAWMIALQAVIYTYDGWNGAVYFSEEVRDAGRAIPRAMFSGVLAVAAIYLLVNLAFLHVLSLSVLARSTFPAAAAARAVFGPLGDTLVSALMLVSLLSAVNAYVMMAPRVLYAMSSDGLAPASATTVNAGGTPTLAMLISSAVAAAFLAGGAFNAVIAVVAYFFVANYALTFTSLFALRRREPELPRPFRSWGYPWTNALALAGAVAFLGGAVVADPRHSLVALGLLVASYPVYRVTRALAARGPASPAP